MLRITGLSKNFGGLKAVWNVNLEVREREIHAILGPNGAGKTTLFNLVTGSLEPVAGSVTLNGQDVTRWSPERLVGAGVARTFQRTSVFPDLSVGENVALAVRSRRRVSHSVWWPSAREREVAEEVSQVLGKVGLAGRERVIASNLAHGDQRALDIAIGLALEPSLILMDEPLAGMARGDREMIGALILKLRDDFGLTVVVVEHDVGMVMRLSDRITVMHNGSVIASGQPNEIREDEAVKRAYLHGSFAV